MKKKLGIGAVAALALLAVSPVSAAAGDQSYSPIERTRPAFEAPFPCGETWMAYTHDWHWDKFKMSDWDLPKGQESKGKPVVASADGVIKEAGRYSIDSNYRGASYVLVDHGRGWSTVYVHVMLESLPAPGTKVKRGQEIAKAGDVGLTPDDWHGAHLHYEQRFFGHTQTQRIHGEKLTLVSSPEQTAIVSKNC
nr:M23 family metallopeptidase [Kibdelosporangium sp. MJ126-NF4]CEL19973.1 peptidase M23B [Kibdelosporangium sp. MJ126-NF4]CTQ97197.1 peptidase M23B [Kibdelosporangium sp. MJ126-NF4]